MIKVLYLYAFLLSSCCFKWKKDYIPIIRYYDAAAYSVSAMGIEYKKCNIYSFKTDTLEGIEIDYYYYINKECYNLMFFVPHPHLSKQKHFHEMFEYEKVGFVKYNVFDLLSAHQYFNFDTFYYSNKGNLYLSNNFSSYPSDAKVYKISKNEFVKFYKVKGIIDEFKGNRYCAERMFPMLSKDEIQDSMTVQWQYRKILDRTVLPVRNPFRLKETKKIINKCVSVY